MKNSSFIRSILFQLESLKKENLQKMKLETVSDLDKWKISQCSSNLTFDFEGISPKFRCHLHECAICRHFDSLSELFQGAILNHSYEFRFSLTKGRYYLYSPNDIHFQVSDIFQVSINNENAQFSAVGH